MKKLNFFTTLAVAASLSNALKYPLAWVRPGDNLPSNYRQGIAVGNVSIPNSIKNIRGSNVTDLSINAYNYAKSINPKGTGVVLVTNTNVSEAENLLAYSLTGKFDAPVIYGTGSNVDDAVQDALNANPDKTFEINN